MSGTDFRHELAQQLRVALAACENRPPVRKLAVTAMPVSGKPGELLHAAHIDAEAVVTAARQLLGA